MNIYNVVIISIKVVSLSSLLADQPTLGYVVVSALLMLSVTGMLLLLFLPKVSHNNLKLRNMPVSQSLI